MRWEEFFDAHDYAGRILSVADTYPETRTLEILFGELNRFDTDFAIHFLRNPQTSLVAGQEAITRKAPSGEEPIHVHLRIKGLPRDLRIMVRDLRAEHLGQFITVEGLVRKATEVRPKITDATFQCLRCQHVIKELQEGQAFREPMECYTDQGGCGRTAASTKFKLIGEVSQYLDTQKIEIQEPPEILRGGQEPQRIEGYLEDDITGQITPGERIVLSGVLRSAQRGKPGARSTIFDIFVDINSVEKERIEFEDLNITPEDVRLIRDEAERPNIVGRIVQSISPTLYGLEMEKEALALQLFGGVPKRMPDGTRIRGDIHALLIGDPGAGKSQLLQYMSTIAPRAMFVSGKGTSAAGLLAAAVKDDFGEGRWTLEAGALVLADRGLACIDEIEKMSPQDRGSLHVAMEEQMVHIAKAGITATLPSRCAVLAAANPKFGRFVPEKYIGEQFNLEPALLSRFDVIFPVQDIPQTERDRRMADHILHAHRLGEIRRTVEELGENPAADEPASAYTPYFAPEFLRKYVAYAKRIYPVMTPDAMDRIRDHYLDIRKQGEGPGASVPITPRQLEAYVRLSEASARARLSPLVDVEDADRAVRIIEYWLRRVATEGGTGPLDIDIVTTGVPASQREQIVLLRDIIAELGGTETGEGANQEDILELAERRGIPRDRAEAWLRKWRQEGDLYSPIEGRYKLVERL
ncbi:MAG TPA: minichromosome maintenance protein MCM [Thermoplasmata archaeon]|nr:minichromosome maintenance protein MCM [Thermoplasmata archaeon]